MPDGVVAGGRAPIRAGGHARGGPAPPPRPDQPRAVERRHHAGASWSCSARSSTSRSSGRWRRRARRSSAAQASRLTGGRPRSRRGAAATAGSSSAARFRDVRDGPRRRRAPRSGHRPGRPARTGSVEAAKATGERDIRSATISSTPVSGVTPVADRAITSATTPVRVLTDPVRVRGQPFYLQVVGDRTTEERTLGSCIVVLVVGGAGRAARRVRASARPTRDGRSSRSAARSSTSARRCAASASSPPTPRTSCGPR